MIFACTIINSRKLRFWTQRHGGGWMQMMLLFQRGWFSGEPFWFSLNHSSEFGRGPYSFPKYHAHHPQKNVAFFKVEKELLHCSPRFLEKCMSFGRITVTMQGENHHALLLHVTVLSAHREKIWKNKGAIISDHFRITYLPQPNVSGSCCEEWGFTCSSKHLAECFLTGWLSLVTTKGYRQNKHLSIWIENTVAICSLSQMV